MNNAERVIAMFRWLEDTAPNPQRLESLSRREAQHVDPTTTRQLDVYALIEIAAQSGYVYFPAEVPHAEWLLPVLTMDFDGIAAHFVGVGRLEVAKALRDRIQNQNVTNWEVPMVLLRRVWSLAANDTFVTHFVDFIEATAALDDRNVEKAVNALNRPDRLATMLEDSDRIIRDWLFQLDETFAVVIRQYEVIRAFGEWPLIQRSVSQLLTDIAWPLRSHRDLLFECITRMDTWTDYAAGKDKITVSAHVERLREAAGSILGSATRPTVLR